MGEDAGPASSIYPGQEPPSSGYGAKDANNAEKSVSESASKDGPYSAIDTSALKNSSQPSSQEGVKFKGDQNTTMNVRNDTIHELPEEEEEDAGSRSSSSSDDSNDSKSSSPSASSS